LGESSPSDLPALQGLRKRAQFLHVRHGLKTVRPSVIVEARPRADSAPPFLGPVGFGLTASKKVGGAVIRNRAKRRLREAAKRLLPAHGLPGVDYVLVARAATAEAPWAGLLDDLGNALIWLRAELEAGDASPSKRRKPKRPAQNRQSTPLPNKGD
jgi:ribonuclease P protein component